MVVYANFLFPLYIYPLNGAWNPLITAAKQYPDVNFTAVINPWDGPGSDSKGCPNKDFVEALTDLHKYPNIKTMGYVHTANRWNCGTSGKDICTCSAPIDSVKRNISTYAGWATAGCPGWTSTKKDIHIDSIFIDEAPGQDKGACLSYMKDLTTYTKSRLTLKTGGQVLFNAGTAVNSSYFDVADVIVILEDTQKAYEAIPDIGVRNGNGKYAQKTSIIIYAASNATSKIQRDTDTVLSVKRNNFNSMFYTDRAVDQYSKFPFAWTSITKQVNAVAQANKAAGKT